MIRPVPSIVVIALGNEWRGDDAVGPILLQRLRQDPPGQVALRFVTGDATQLLAAMDTRDAVLVMDAVVTGAVAGTVHHWRWHDACPALEGPRYSTHTVNIADALALAEALGQPRPELIVIGIEAAQFQLGAGLSPAVSAALDEALSTVNAELCRLQRG